MRNQSKSAPLTPAHLIQFRKRYNLSQKQIAAYLLVHPLTWGRWERGECAIPINLHLTLKPIADKLRELEAITKN